MHDLKMQYVFCSMKIYAVLHHAQNALETLLQLNLNIAIKLQWLLLQKQQQQKNFDQRMCC
jgi:hypothetical protein